MVWHMKILSHHEFIREGTSTGGLYVQLHLELPYLVKMQWRRKLF